MKKLIVFVFMFMFIGLLSTSIATAELSRTWDKHGNLEVNILNNICFDCLERKYPPPNIHRKTHEMRFFIEYPIYETFDEWTNNKPYRSKIVESEWKAYIPNAITYPEGSKFKVLTGWQWKGSHHKPNVLHTIAGPYSIYPSRTFLFKCAGKAIKEGKLIKPNDRGSIPFLFKEGREYAFNHYYDFNDISYDKFKSIRRDFTRNKVYETKFRQQGMNAITLILKDYKFSGKLSQGTYNQKYTLVFDISKLQYGHRFKSHKSFIYKKRLPLPGWISKRYFTFKMYMKTHFGHKQKLFKELDVAIPFETKDKVTFDITLPQKTLEKDFARYVDNSSNWKTDVPIFTDLYIEVYEHTVPKNVSFHDHPIYNWLVNKFDIKVSKPDVQIKMD